ncbi:MAG: hypothetical protein M3Z10_00140, partial [Gemmatimonadota bacterium]|nr:hypothetical protein [Gemmatimonadota bacterium]
RPGGKGSDLLLVRTTGVARVGGVEMDADLAVVCRDVPEGDIRSVALFGDQSRLSVDGITFEAAGAAEFVRRGAEWSIEGRGRIIVR